MSFEWYTNGCLAGKDFARCAFEKRGDENERECCVCHLMDQTTFQKPGVQEEFRNFTRVKYEVQTDPDIRQQRILDRFDIVGLPVYLVFKPKQQKEGDK